MPENLEVFREHHYKPTELAKLWGVSPDTIRRLFRDEAGVIRLENKKQAFKHVYTTLLIPESVARRVYTRLSAPASVSPVALPTALKECRSSYSNVRSHE